MLICYVTIKLLRQTCLLISLIVAYTELQQIFVNDFTWTHCASCLFNTAWFIHMLLLIGLTFDTPTKQEKTYLKPRCTPFSGNMSFNPETVAKRWVSLNVPLAFVCCSSLAEPVLPSPWFSRRIGLLYHCCRGLFFMSVGWSDPKNMIFSHWNVNFTGGSPPKNVYFTPLECDFYRETPSNRDWAIFGLFLSSNWAGFVVKTWQPWAVHFRNPPPSPAPPV